MTWIFWTSVYLLAQFAFAMLLGNAFRQRETAAQITGRTMTMRQQGSVVVSRRERS